MCVSTRVCRRVNCHCCASRCARNTTTKCFLGECQYKSYLNFVRHSYVLCNRHFFFINKLIFFRIWLSFCVFYFAFVDFVNFTIVTVCSRAHIPTYPYITSNILFYCLPVCKLPFVAVACRSPLM